MAQDDKVAEDQNETTAPQGDVANTAEAEPTAPNVVTTEEAGPCKKKITIEIPEETVRKATDAQYEDLRREVVLPGFRKGRAPRRLLEKRFGKETAEQIKLKLIAEASEKAMEDEKLDVLGEPDMDFEKVEMPETGPLKFDFEVEVRPEFELPELEGIEVTRTALEVTDDQVDREVKQMQRWAGLWTPREKDAAVELDDQVIGDVLLKVEDVEEEEKLDNTEVHVRPGGFVGSVPVEDLDKLLVGAKPGETKETSVDVPKTFFREAYRGKKVDVKIRVEEIKYLRPAEMDADFLARYNVENEDELRERIRDTLQNQLEQRVRAEMSEQIYEHLLDKTDFDLPLDVVARQAGSILRRQYVNLLTRGLPPEQIKEQMEALQAGSEEQAKQQLKTFFVMDAVADKLEIEVTEEEINGHIAQAAIQRNQRPERLREEMQRDGSLDQFRLEIRQNKCIEKLLESAKITEKKPEKKAEKKAKKTTKSSKKSEKKSAKKSTKKTAKQTEDKADETGQ